MGRFTLTIELGNDSMQAPQDVAVALRRVVTSLLDGATAGGVRDANGNTVGAWELSE